MIFNLYTVTAPYEYAVAYSLLPELIAGSKPKLTDYTYKISTVLYGNVQVYWCRCTVRLTAALRLVHKLVMGF